VTDIEYSKNKLIVSSPNASSGLKTARAATSDSGGTDVVEKNTTMGTKNYNKRRKWTVYSKTKGVRESTA